MKFFYTKICKNSFWNLDIYIIDYTRIMRNIYFNKERCCVKKDELLSKIFDSKK